jgi:hypothetical protein
MRDIIMNKLNEFVGQPAQNDCWSLQRALEAFLSDYIKKYGGDLGQGVRVTTNFVSHDNWAFYVYLNKELFLYVVCERYVANKTKVGWKKMIYDYAYKEFKVVMFNCDDRAKKIEDENDPHLLDVILKNVYDKTMEREEAKRKLEDNTITIAAEIMKLCGYTSVNQVDGFLDSMKTVLYREGVRDRILKEVFSNG